MSGKNLLILVDMDGICVDFLGKVMKSYNEDYGDTLHLAEMKKEDIVECIDPSRIKMCDCGHLNSFHKDNLYSCYGLNDKCTCVKFLKKPRMTWEEFDSLYMYKPGFFADMKPLPGALEALKLFHEEKHEIIICTSQSGPDCAKEKLEWLESHMPWWTRKDILMGHQKWRIKGDILIDDHPRNIRNYKKAWPEAKVFSIEYPYNEYMRDTADLMAESCFNTFEAWKDIAIGVDDLCEGRFEKQIYIKDKSSTNG